MASLQTSAPDDYFNDLSRQPHTNTSPDQSEIMINGDDPGPPKPKRIACVICRKRKLRCDGGKPSCGTCSRLGHSCAYDEVRRKSGPKRGYVKELETRLAQVEAQLDTKAYKKPASSNPRKDSGSPVVEKEQILAHDSRRSMPQNTSFQGSMDSILEFSNGGSTKSTEVNKSLEKPSWEIISLGLEEPLPTQEAIDELHQIYFDYVHNSVPIVHQYRYRAAMALAPHMRPPVCLRYAIWCIAASISDRYYNHQNIFYQRARKYAEADEMKGQGEGFGSVGHAQCWILIASYEFKTTYFPRAWASSGRSTRLCQMLGLHRLDGAGLDVKLTLPPPRDWTELEERRRTFWMAYCVDRYASVGTGWPMIMDEKDIRTNLPASEDAFEKSVPEQTQPLSGAMTAPEAATLSPFAGVVITASYFGHNLTHLHQPGPNERENDLHGEFWSRHRKMDNTLLNTSLSLPAHLRLPSGIRDANVVFLNMGLQTSTICLHQAAIYKAESNSLPRSIIEQSQVRCLLAANEVATLMRVTSHLETASMNPFTAFCIYVAANVFLQTLKKTPDDQVIRATLEFLLSAMLALKRRNPLSESFLAQLRLDLEGTGLASIHNPDFSSLMQGVNASSTDTDLKCMPILDFRDPQIKKSMECKYAKKDGLYAPANSSRELSNSVNSRGPAASPFQNVVLPTREPLQNPQTWNQPTKDDAVNLENILPNSPSWSVNSMSAFVTAPLDTSAVFDMNMFEGSDEQRSSRLTPSTNHSPSNTSYSPPQEDEFDNNNNNSTYGSTLRHPLNSGSNTSATAPSPSASFFMPMDETTFSPSSTIAHRSHERDSVFKIPEAWQLGSTGEVSSSLAGMSPGSDERWVQMSNNMVWDGTAAGPDNALWSDLHGPTT